jgi:predicted dehydrogenase
MKIAVLGAGNISGIYGENLTGRFKNIDVIGCVDLIRKRSENFSKTYNVKRVYKDLNELLDDKDVQLVLDITRPNEHFDTMKQVIEAKKHAYVEKPLSTKFFQGSELVKLAKENNVKIGGAPDTFLGAGIQTCKKLINDGYIGRVIGATAFMLGHGHETWHPDPEFYYKKGGGPMFDMGPYYITCLINLIGGIKQVAGINAKAFNERIITSKEHFGEKIDVEIMTHVASNLLFENGAVGTLITSFDVWRSDLPLIEIYGTDGTLSVPDPNTFGGPVKITNKDGDFYEFPVQKENSDNSRGIGLSDMVNSIENNLDFYECNENQLLHVLEVMEKIHTSFKKGTYENIQTPFNKNITDKI